MLVQFDVKGPADKAKEKIAPMLDVVAGVQSAHPNMIVEEFGQASADYQVGKRFDRDMGRVELISLPLTIAILIIAFGALVAAGLPVLLAFSAVLAATGVNSLVSHVLPTDRQTLSAIILMIGMAVGIDYSLFYLRREREERAEGRSSHDALSSPPDLGAGGADLGRHRPDRDGRHVRVGQLPLRDDRARHDDRRPGRDGRLADGAAGVLSKLGDKVDWGRIPYVGRGSRDDGRWAHFVAAVLRRPWTAMFVSAGALIVLALPAASIHTKLPNLTDLPHDLAIVRTYERIQRAFPGSQTPAVVVVKAPKVDTPQMQRAFALFRKRAVATGQLYAPSRSA